MRLADAEYELELWGRHFGMVPSRRSELEYRVSLERASVERLERRVIERLEYP
jgi:hypothetical protein